MLKGQDIVALVALAVRTNDWTVRSLEVDTGISRATLHRSLQRLDAAGLYDLERRRVRAAPAEEFLIHAVRYVFPPERDGEARGVPTAWAVEPLVSELAPTGEPPPVWPSPHGSSWGIALTPLHPAIPEIAGADPELGERLALVDALRIGDARIRDLAARHLRARLSGPAPAG